MTRYPEIEEQIVAEKCILSLMRSKNDNSKYVSNARHAENFTGTKELVMMKWKI